MASGIGSLYAEVAMSERALASPIFGHVKKCPEFKEYPEEGNLSDSSSDTTIITTNSTERRLMEMKSKVDTDWIGTSQFSVDSSIAMQKSVSYLPT
jgi:hypothetical protein